MIDFKRQSAIKRQPRGENGRFIKASLDDWVYCDGEHTALKLAEYEKGSKIKNRYYLVWAVGTILGMIGIYFATHLYKL